MPFVRVGLPLAPLCLNDGAAGRAPPRAEPAPPAGGHGTGRGLGGRLRPPWAARSLGGGGRRRPALDCALTAGASQGNVSGGGRPRITTPSRWAAGESARVNSNALESL